MNPEGVSLDGVPRLELKRRPLNLHDYRMRHATDGDAHLDLNGPVIITEHGRPVVLQLQPALDLEALRRALTRVEFRTAARTATLPHQSRTFGYLPRVAIRYDYCRTSTLDAENPAAHELLTDTARLLEPIYAAARPDVHQQHREAAGRILPSYRIEDTVFTSGIVNYNNPLPYHHDKGNIKGAWSAMLVFKHRVAGGHLSVPEFDASFKLPDKSLFLFDGSQILHGVTPIRTLAPDAHRFSVVYYSLKGLWSCEPPGKELERIQRSRTVKERKRRDEDRARAGAP